MHRPMASASQANARDSRVSQEGESKFVGTESLSLEEKVSRNYDRQ